MKRSELKQIIREVIEESKLIKEGNWKTHDTSPEGWGEGVKRTKYPDGIIRYELPDGKLHREDGPALEAADGYGPVMYYINGKLHREDGPAKLMDNVKYWYENGVLLKKDSPVNGVTIFK